MSTATLKARRRYKAPGGPYVPPKPPENPPVADIYTMSDDNSKAGWNQVLAENFDVDVARSDTAPKFRTFYPNIKTYDGFYDTSKRGYYSDTTLSASGGQLKMDIGWNEAIQKYGVTEILPYGWTGLFGGRFDFCMDMDFVSQFKIVPLWWTIREHWADGEMDFPESGALGGGFDINVHQVNIVGSEKINVYQVKNVKMADGVTNVPLTTKWVFSHRWVPKTDTTPGELSFWINDRLVGRTQNPNGIPTVPMRFAIQVEVSDLSGNTIPLKTNKGQVRMDWITGYSYAGAPPVVAFA